MVGLLSYLLFEGYSALTLFSMAEPGATRRSNDVVTRSAHLPFVICYRRVAGPVGRAKARPDKFAVSDSARTSWLLTPVSWLLFLLTAYSNHTPQRSAGVCTGASQSLVN